MHKNKEKLCDWRKKDIQANLQGLLDIVTEPKYVCLKCGRVANSSERLCKAADV